MALIIMPIMERISGEFRCQNREVEEMAALATIPRGEGQISFETLKAIFGDALVGWDAPEAAKKM